ncbi:MAG TPA: polysaccharide biosynthesis C-terminal domain-containing protein, partial [Candidatus Binatia bacterium]|nr:polysaccharide biosynthesis C-terminal domain-containing protein [Candidatus Binatia bacterium]
EHMSKYLTNYLFIQFCLGLGFMLIMAGFVYSAEYPQHVKNALYVASVGLFLSSMSLPFRSVIVSMQRLTITARINFFNALINVSMMALAIAFRQNVFFLAFISVAVSVFDILIYGVIVHKKFARVSFALDKAFIRSLFIWNTPFMLLTFFSIYNRIDGLILPHFRSFVETGYYTAAYKFWDALAYFPGILGITLYPFFAHAISRGLLDDARNGLETYTRYMIAIAFPMSVGAFFMAERILIDIIDPEFAPAAPALWLLIIAVSILFIYTPVNSLIISQLTRTATKVTAFTFFFNLILNILLIPKFGFVAAAAITALSELIQALGYTYFVKTKIVKFQIFRNMFKPLAASIIMGAFLFVFQAHNLWIVIALGGLIYATSLFILGFFHKSDWELFKAAVNVKKELNPEQTKP